MTERLPRTAASVAVALATAIVLVALAILPFLNPVWVGFEQARSQADVWTGYTPNELRTATDAILADLVLGPPEFDVEVRGEPVLSAAERGHMADVRRVVLGFGIVALAAAALLLAAHRRARGAAAFWRAVQGGAIGLIGATMAVAIVSFLAFEAAFEAFHRIFFSGGNYQFDPTTDRLVQLFPYRFWVETSFAVGIVILVLSAVAVVLAGRRLARPAVESVVRPVRVGVGR